MIGFGSNLQEKRIYKAPPITTKEEIFTKLQVGLLCSCLGFCFGALFILGGL